MVSLDGSTLSLASKVIVTGADHQLKLAFHFAFTVYLELMFDATSDKIL
jgi:hypothetical protein